MDRSTLKSFPWMRLPQHIQQRILSYAVLPDGPGTALIVGEPDHSAHLGRVAVPILLALGSWTGYLNGVRVLYREVHLDISLHRRSSMSFLTVHRALRPRSMVMKIRITVDIKKSLPLFDTGYTIRQSKGKLIKTNIPTALRCMKVHGQLSQVEFLIANLTGTMEAGRQVPEDYLPLAEIQLVNLSVLQVGDKYASSPSDEVCPDTEQAETVIAPAFLACRAWQSGFLPLMEDGTFQKGASLGLLLNAPRPDQDRAGQEDNGNRICPLDGTSLMRYWIGGTIVELLDESLKPLSWINPFVIPRPEADDLDSAVHSMETHRSGTSPHDNTIVDSTEDNVAGASNEASHRSLGSACKGGETENHKPPRGYSALSDDGSLSGEVETRTPHQRLGFGCRACENISSASSSSSKSPTRSGMLAAAEGAGKMASPSSSPEIEVCWKSTRKSVSLREDRPIDLVTICSTEDSSGSEQNEEKALDMPMRESGAPYKRLPTDKDQTDTNGRVQNLAMAGSRLSPNRRKTAQIKCKGDHSRAGKEVLKGVSDERLHIEDDATPPSH